jgi:hypothetical protein
MQFFIASITTSPIVTSEAFYQSSHSNPSILPQACLDFIVPLVLALPRGIPSFKELRSSTAPQVFDIGIDHSPSIGWCLLMLMIYHS